jgi:hypothetical protein
MRGSPRVLVAAASVGAIAAAVVLSLALGPRETGSLLAVPGVAAIALSVSSVVAEPRELLAALFLATAPTMALVHPEASSWMIGPIAVLLLLGAELNAWSWELGGSEPIEWRRRLVSIVQLAAMGLAASLVVGIAARAVWLNGLVAVGVAAAAIAALGWMIRPGARRRGGSSRP